MQDLLMELFRYPANKWFENFIHILNNNLDNGK